MWPLSVEQCKEKIHRFDDDPVLQLSIFCQGLGQGTPLEQKDLKNHHTLILCMIEIAVSEDDDALVNLIFLNEMRVISDAMRVISDAMRVISGIRPS